MKIYHILQQTSEESLCEDQSTTGNTNAGTVTSTNVSGGDSVNSTGSDDSSSDSDNSGNTDSDAKTSANDISTVIYPLGSLISRPYFHYVRPSKKCKYGKKKDGKCKKKPR